MKKLYKIYPWLIAAVTLLQLGVVGGTTNNLTSLFVIPVTGALEVSRGSFALAISAKGLAGFLSTFLSGVILQKIGYRKGVVCFLLLGTAGMILAGLSNQLWMLIAGLALFGFGDGICLSAGPPRLIRHWFHKHQGTVLGAVSAATGLGGSLLVILLTGAMDRGGWRWGYFCVAGLLLTVALLVLVIIRDRPEKMGLRPYGEGQYTYKKRESSTTHWEGFAMAELLRKPGFYLMMALTLVGCFCIYLASQTVQPHLLDVGLSKTQAESMQSLFMLLLAVTKLAAGFLGDRIGGRWVTVLCASCGIASLIVMALAKEFFSGLAGIVLLSCGLPMSMLAVPLLLPDLFGYRAQTAAMGLFLSMTSVASMTASPLVGTVYDLCGSYRPAYWAGAAGLTIVLALYLLLFKICQRDKDKFMENENRC